MRLSGPSLALTVALSMVAHSALADEVVLPNTRVVVIDPKQNAAWGGPAIAKSLRKKLDAATGQSIPAGAYTKALKALKLKGNAANDPANIAKAAKQVGADYALVLSITKKGWLFTANAVLLNTTTGEQQMDFKSGYYKPKNEAADRGERIARVTIEKLAALGPGGAGGAVAVAPPPAPDDIPEPRGGRGADRVEEPAPRDRGADRVDEPPSARDDRVDEPPLAKAREDEPPPRVASSGSGGASASSSGGSSGGSGGSGGFASTREPEARPTSRPDRITEPGGRRDEAHDLVRATVQGGAGVLHTFDLDSADGRRSRLSYQLDPLALIVGEVEVLIPAVNTGVFARAAFSPVRFQVTVGASSDEPSGSILDLAFGLKLNLALSGEGRETVRLSPLAGLKLGLLSVSDHPSDLILGSTSVAPFLGAELSLPITAQLETLFGAEVGLVVGYSESPTQSKNGEFGSGVLFGAGLGVRYWLTDALGVAFDGRFDLRSIGLEGNSLRQTPSGETLTDASIGNRDLRFSVGVALRL